MKRIASVVLSLFVAAIASAQVRESVSVEVVQVPVYVSTYNGVVTGLTRDNFRLFVNGKSQAIDYFDVVDFSAINVPEEERLDPRQRRLYLLVFDLLFSTPIAIARAQVAVDRLLLRAGRSDEFSVATYRHNRGIELLVPFTRDRGAIRRAVQTLKPSGTSDVLRLAVNPEETEALTQGIEFDESEASSNPTTQLAGADEEMLHQPLKNLIEDQIANLASIGQRLAPLEGQKHVVLLSTGFSSRMVHGVGAQTNPGNLRTMSADPLTARMSLPHPVKDEIDARLVRVLQALDSEYAAAGVFLDAIDIAGLRPGGSPTENEGLVMLARDTGGDLIEKRNNLAEALEVLTDRQRVVYVLGFHARNTHREQNSIEVRLRNVEGHPLLHYRRGYSSAAPVISSNDGIRIADILLNDIPQSGLEVRTSVGPPSEVNVIIPASQLLAQVEKSVEANILIYIFSAEKAVASADRRLSLDRERIEAAGREGVIRFTQPFKLPPGDYTAKVIVRLEGTPVLGFTRADFTVKERQ